MHDLEYYSAHAQMACNQISQVRNFVSHWILHSSLTSCFDLLKNLSVLSRIERIWRWKVGMATHNFSQNYKKFVTTIHDFFPNCQLLKWVQYIGMNKINRSVLKNLPFWAGWNEYDDEKLAWRRTIFHKVLKVCNDFSWLFPRLSTSKMGSLHCYE